MTTLEEAGCQAEAIAEDVTAAGSLEPAYKSLEMALAAYLSAGGSADDVVPGGDVEGLGFSRQEGSGRRLWERYVQVLREELCSPQAELHQQVRMALNAGGAGVVGAVLTALGVSVVAAGVIAPIAGVLLALGLKAFCDLQAVPEDAS